MEDIGQDLSKKEGLVKVSTDVNIEGANDVDKDSFQRLAY